MSEFLRAFTCGHAAPIPRNMGRGQARERRLSDYYGRVCMHCAIARAEDYAYSLTVPSNEDGPTYRGKVIAREEARIRRAY